MVLFGTKRKRLIVKKAKTASRVEPYLNSETPMRDRVLSAAFSAFMERGYEGASTLDIATRAKVSKRGLYSLFDNKHAMLTACIAERAKQMRLPLNLPAASDREALAATLNVFGIAILRGVCDPKVLAVYRLAIAESGSSPEIARVLDKAGREANRAALVELLTAAQANGLFGAVEPATMAARFFALIWGDLLVRLLLRVTNVPKLTEIEERVRAATEILMALYPEPISRPRHHP
jgi:AcrR family transcriptional regulator